MVLSLGRELHVLVAASLRILEDVSFVVPDHDNEKIVIRNYEGNIFEYPETGGDQNVQFAPQREYHDEYLYS